MIGFLSFLRLLSLWYKIFPQRRKKKLNVYYEPNFIVNIKSQTSLDNFSRLRPLPMNSGNQIKFFTEEK